MGKQTLSSIETFRTLKETLGETDTGFCKPVIEVPNFQRNYSWQVENIKEFCDTFFNKESNGKEYLGTILLVKNERKYEIIDGQQRVTTYILMLNALLELFQENGCTSVMPKLINYINDFIGENEKQFFVQQKLDDLFMKFYVERKLKTYHNVTITQELTNTEIISKLVQYNGSKSLYDSSKNAYETMKLELKKNIAPDVSEDDIFFRIDNVMFNLIVTDDIENALKIFSTTNSTGRNLGIYDLIKGLMFKYYGENDVSEFMNIDTVWTTFFEQKEISNLEVVQIFDLVMNVEYLECVESIWSSTKTYEKLKKVLNSFNSDTEELLEFHRFIEHYTHLYIYCKNGELSSFSVKKREFLYAYKDELKRIITKNYKPTLPILFYVLSKYEQKELESDIEDILNYIFYAPFIKVSICKESPTVLYSETKNMIKYDYNISHVIQNFSQNIDTCIFIKKLGDKYFSNDDAKEILKLINPNVPLLSTNSVHTEHVFPQTPKLEEWEHFSDSNKDDYVYRIGNMILLPDTLNIKMSNGSFKNKIADLRENIDLLTLYDDYKFLFDIDDYTPDVIEIRSNNIACYVCNHFSKLKLLQSVNNDIYSIEDIYSNIQSESEIYCRRKTAQEIINILNGGEI